MIIKVRVLKTFSQKLFGLIDSSQKPPVFLKTRFGIHTFFMRYSIDIILLSDNGEVIKMSQSLKPFSFFFYSFLYSKVIELESGFIKKNKIQIGDRIKLKYEY